MSQLNILQNESDSLELRMAATPDVVDKLDLLDEFFLSVACYKLGAPTVDCSAFYETAAQCCLRLKEQLSDPKLDGKIAFYQKQARLEYVASLVPDVMPPMFTGPVHKTELPCWLDSHLSAIQDPYQKIPVIESFLGYVDGMLIKAMETIKPFERADRVLHFKELYEKAIDAYEAVDRELVAKGLVSDDTANGIQYCCQMGCVTDW